MKKFLFGAAAAVALTFTMNVGAAEVFAKVNDYAKVSFEDVAENAWYAPEIKNAYELGFMNGTSDTQMSPDGTVTVAQAVTIASRANAVYNGRSAELEKNTGSKWYDVYLDYAEKYGIINKEDFNSFDRAARRYEVALMFAKALPESHYTAKNNVTSIPDVYPEDDFYDEILMLYKAGVVMGSDDYGTFFPNNSIKRSEIAAIINRAALPEGRKTGTLKEYTDHRMDQAVLLIDDLTAITHNRKDDLGGTDLNHAWNIDDRGNPTLNKNAVYNGSFSDMKDDSLVAVRRYITPVTDQHVVLETRISLSDAGDGFSVYLSSPDKKPVVGFVSENGYWGVLGKTNTMSKIAYVDGINDFKLDMDLAGKSATLFVNGELAATGEIGDFDSLNEISFSTSDEGEMAFGFVTTRLYMNYNLFDSFRWEAFEKAPYGYKTEGNVLVKTKTTGDFDPQSVQMDGASSASKSFEAMKDGFVVEAYVLPVSDTNKASVELKNGTETVVKIDMENGVYSVGGQKIWQYHGDIWQIIRVEKSSDGKAIVRLCGKDAYEFDYNGAVDSITITNEGTELWFDDVKAYNTYDFVDYVSQPVAVNEMDDYILTMSVCSLWHEGTHYGWDFVAPYDELIPIMGFYDEGLVETADWEIKYMVEHGIDAFQPCWYAGTSSTDNPMKIARNNQYAVHDGYFNAKYKDMLDICIMWENQGYKTGLTKEKFQRLLWNYWVDYYFTDPNYLTIDNKAFLTIYRMDVFLSCFSSGEEAMEVLDFMREDIKNYGYDDIIITFNCYSDNANKYDTTAKDAGLKFDGYVPYHWGINAHDPEFVKNQHNMGYTGKGDNFIVPCASTGRNIIGWEQSRSPIATHEQHVEVLEFIKNDYLKRAEADFGEGSWQSKLVFFGTWNEYAEGHWIAPTGRNGNGPYFDYPSAWANVFAGVDTSVYDIEPTAGQKARIAYLYPAVEVPIRAWLLESDGEEAPTETEIPTTVVAKVDFNNADDVALFTFHRTDSHTFADGKVTIVAESAETKGDSIMRTDKFKDIDTSKVDALHIRMKATATSNINIYPTFDYDAAHTAAKSMKAKYTTPGEWQDIYIDLRESPFWQGKLSNLRLNLFNGAYGTYECDTIELMTYGDKSNAETDVYGIFVDGVKLDISKGYINDDGSEVYLAALPVQGFYACTNIYHEWYRFDGEGKLYLKAGNGANVNEIVFTVGSKTALVNGTEKTLAKEFYLYDAIPVLPLKFVYDNLGIKYTYDATNGIKTDIRDVDFSAILDSRKSHQYDFDVAGDLEGWSFGKATGFVLDGAAVVVPLEQSGGKFDPIFSTTKLRPEVLVATNCDTITVRMKYEIPEGEEIEAWKLAPQLFFNTSSDTSFAASRQVNAQRYKDAPIDEEGWAIFTFDMTTNENWKGSITQLRLDPSSSGATAIIDYIKCNLKDTGIDEGTIYEEEVAVKEYNFDEEVDTKIVSMTRATATYENGHLVMEATPTDNGRYDPIINVKEGFDASTVGKVVVRLKLEGISGNEGIQLYFATPDANYSADRCISLSYSKLKADSDGYYTVTFDTSELKDWNGAIKSVRIDPYNSAGKAYVDYIKLYAPKGGTVAPAPSTPATPSAPVVTPDVPAVENITIVNGDAEDTANDTAFYSMYGSNKVSIVEDPTNPNNHVWKVEPTKEGKVYVSLVQNVTYTPGKTYRLEYDAYVVGNFKGESVEKVELWENVIYNDGKSNHTKGAGKGMSGQWVHCAAEVTVDASSDDRSKDAIAMFATPQNDMGMVVLVDNFTLTRVD